MYRTVFFSCYNILHCISLFIVTDMLIVEYKNKKSVKEFSFTDF